MKVPEKSFFRNIGRVLLFAPVVIFFFLSFSFWKKGLTEPAIIFGLMGIGLILLFCLLGIIQRIIEQKKRFVIVCAVLLISIGLYCLITGDFYPGIGLTLLGLAFILEMTFLQKKRQIGITVVVLLALGGITYLEHFSGDKTQPVGSEVGDKQNAVVKNNKPHRVPSVKSSALDSPKSPLVGMMNQFLTPDQREDPKIQEMMAMMDSDSFQEQLKEHNPQTLEEFYQFLASQGVTELSEIDIDKNLADSYRIAVANYKAKNPGKAPEDESIFGRGIIALFLCRSTLFLGVCNGQFTLVKYNTAAPRPCLLSASHYGGDRSPMFSMCREAGYAPRDGTGVGNGNHTIGERPRFSTG